MGNRCCQGTIQRRVCLACVLEQVILPAVIPAASRIDSISHDTRALECMVDIKYICLSLPTSVFNFGIFRHPHSLLFFEIHDEVQLLFAGLFPAFRGYRPDSVSFPY